MISKTLARQIVALCLSASMLASCSGGASLGGLKPAAPGTSALTGTTSPAPTGTTSPNPTSTVAVTGASCARLMSAATNSGVTITSSTLVASSSSALSYCDVLGTIAPMINFEISLPITWNRRMFMLGNGGFAGEAFSSFSTEKNYALTQGFEYAHTDEGTNGGTASGFTNDNIVSFGYRAVHITAVEAKLLAKLFYATTVAHSYWDGCSTGGREGFMEAQRYPADFNGILAGDPGFRGADLYINFAWIAQNQAKGQLTSPQIKTIGASLLQKCDALDGTTDGIIADPRRCMFNPITDGAALTPAQLTAYQNTTNGAVNQYGQETYGLAYGTEVGVGYELAVLAPIYQTPPNYNPYGSIDGNFGEQFLQYLAPYPSRDPNEFNVTSLNFNVDPYKMSGIRSVVDAQNPNLNAFAALGGKMISYQGWTDPLNSPYEMVDYAETMFSTMGYANARNTYRQYMIPAMGHCGDTLGGYGPDTWDGITPLIAWVEKGVAPDGIVVSQYAAPGGEIYYNGSPTGAPVRSRLICPYPEAGKGGSNSTTASEFTCVQGLQGLPVPKVNRSMTAGAADPTPAPDNRIRT